MKSLKPRRRINYIGVLAVSLLCLLLIFASHRFTTTSGDYVTTSSSSSAAAAGAVGSTYEASGGGIADPHSLSALRAHRNRDYQLHHINRPHQTQRLSTANDVDPFTGAGDDAAAGVAATAATSSAAATAAMRTVDILAAQRDRVATDMLGFEYTGGPEQTLRTLAPATGGQPMRSLIITTWRSGSTFLGDILNAMPANFYHYEPLLQYDIRQIRDRKDGAAAGAVQQLRQLLACNYTGAAMAEYLEFGATHNYLFNHNTRLWRYCRVRPQLCSDAAFLGAFCALHPLQSMKVVRMRLALAGELLGAAELAETVRVVLLVRDPRGVLQSRKHREWCPGRADCDRAQRLCGDMVADWHAARRLQKRWPGRVKWMRYEDLSVEPYARTQELLGFYGLPFDVAVEEFLDSHTRSDVGGVSSTFRDSKSAPFHWMGDLSWREVQEMQSWCGEAMRLWGYVEAESRATLRSRGFNPLGNVTWT